jgi:hypothetical protein
LVQKGFKKKLYKKASKRIKKYSKKTWKKRLKKFQKKPYKKKLYKMNWSEYFNSINKTNLNRLIYPSSNTHNFLNKIKLNSPIHLSAIKMLYRWYLTTHITRVKHDRDWLKI